MPKKKVTISLTRKKKKTKSAKRASDAQEISLLGKAFRGLGGYAGGAIGSAFGAPVAGASIGSSLGATISKWLGSGDYSVSSNTLVSRVQNGSPAIPMMHSGGQTFTVRHKEYLGEITGSTSFAVRHIYDINPGLSYTFPWLSDLARCFQEYRIKGMVFHYVPTSGSAISGTNAAIGSVMMQTSYRATEAAPGSKVEMLNEYWACEAASNEAFCHPLECDPKENPFNVQYVRSVNLPTTENQLMYDLGRTFIAVSGQPANGNVIGDLWVTYEVELKKPIVISTVVQNPAGVTMSSLASFAPSTSNWFGSSTTQLITGPLACTFATNSITFPKGSFGEYLVTIRFNAPGSLSAIDLSGAPAISAGTAAVANPFQNTLSGTNVYYRTVASGGALTYANYIFAVIIVDPQAITTVNCPTTVTWAGTVAAVDVTIAKLSDTILQ